MSEKTRKRLALFLYAVGLLAMVVIDIFSLDIMEACGISFPMLISAETAEAFQHYILMSNLFSMGFGLTYAAFFFLAFRVLRPLLNAAVRPLFNRLWIALAAIPVVTGILNMMHMGTGENTLLVVLLCVCYAVSGAAPVLRNYGGMESALTALLIAVFLPLLSDIVFITDSMWDPEELFGSTCLSTVGSCVGLGTQVLKFMGLYYLVRGNLVGEEAAAETDFREGRDWWSRPVVGVLCGTLVMVAGMALTYNLIS